MKGLKRKKVVLAVLMLFAVYFFAGMLLPFCRLKTVGEDFAAGIQGREYYGEEGAGTDRACIIETAQEALDVRLQMLASAKESIVLATFDIRDGESTRDIAAVLLAAADRGVRVEMLVDGVSGLLRMRKPLFKLLGSHENIEIRLYNEPNLLLPWTLNGRMHDKYIMVDGSYLLMGGRNTFDYFLGAYTDKNLSLDREVFFVSDKEEAGSAIAQMDSYYRAIREKKECRTLYDKAKYGEGVSQRQLREELSDRYDQLKRNAPKNFEGIAFVKQTVLVNRATLLYNPTNITGKEPWLFYELAGLMRQAEERLYVHTPYVVCDSYMYGELARAASGAGEAVIQLNAVANGDNVCASADYLYHKKELLRCGLTVFEYDGGDSSHGKSMLIDDRLSVIGSYNFDMRSTYIDTELMFVLDSRELNQSLYENLKRLEEDAMRVISEKSYAIPDGHEPSRLPKGKEIFLKIFGVLMQPFRYFL